MSTDPRIEPAARALYEYDRNASCSPDRWPDWDSPDNNGREIGRDMATAAIAAADKAATITEVKKLDTLRTKLRITKVTANDEVLPLIDRVEVAETAAFLLTASEARLNARAEAAEAKVAAVRELAQRLREHPGGSGEHEAADAIDGALTGHWKTLGGTPTGDFADVCACGKSYWPCDSLDGTA